VNSGQPQGAFRPGQGAVVEGVLGADGVFRSDVLLVKHSNQYEPPAGGSGRPQEDTG
jgi:cytochrome c-type biogenesis protein CcmE